ncbi:hypothetical protein K505DRAFT_19223 [Melanomma pulvis-pyrius CBS 109.77]|uniref:Uncharacterized protein n=1 Tax=Melanomma pulvis-pyrius CBS 109.77 TaxID=1314802 RepID=A0A6A6XEW0_9PLEO|nr:hypothetical protein K505DRAFT_19223 [Melanomma pulvis-pyrius CBS 109.77]
MGRQGLKVALLRGPRAQEHRRLRLQGEGRGEQTLVFWAGDLRRAVTSGPLGRGLVALFGHARDDHGCAVDGSRARWHRFEAAWAGIMDRGACVVCVTEAGLEGGHGGHGRSHTSRTLHALPLQQFHFCNGRLAEGGPTCAALWPPPTVAHTAASRRASTCQRGECQAGGPGQWRALLSPPDGTHA